MQKFVLVEDRTQYKNAHYVAEAVILRMGDVSYHADLVNDNEICFGGGMYEIDEENKELILDDISCDYGQPEWGRVNGIVLTESLQSLIADGYNIKYVYPEYFRKEPINVNELVIV